MSSNADIRPVLRDRVRGGRGLGLAGVLGVVRSHGGATGVETVAREPEPALPAQESRPTGTVLVADDEEAIRGIARAALERAGFAVLTAADGRECVEVLRQRQEEIDVVVLDLTMPILGGTDALRELHAIRPDLPVILSSGYTEEDVTARTDGGGAVGFVQKPYRPSALVASVRAALGG